MKIFIIILFFLAFSSCGYIENQKKYFSDLKVYAGDEEYILKRYIFLSHILKDSSRASFVDLHKASFVYTGRMIFISAPRYLPDSIREAYKNDTISLYQSLFYNNDYKNEMKYVSFDCYSESKETVKEASKMKEGDMSMIESAEGYTIFFLESNSRRLKKYRQRYIYKQKISEEKYIQNEKTYMNNIYYSKDIVRNYSSLLDLDSNENLLIASYNTNEIRTRDFVSNEAYKEAYKSIAQAAAYEEKILIFEETVLRPLVERFHFASLPLYTNPVYNMYKSYWDKYW